MRQSKRTRHFLYHGELTDAPGRCESWNDYLTYLGRGRWELLAEGTDFSGICDIEPVKQLMSTRALIDWVMDRDAELEETSTPKNEDDGDGEEESPQRSLGLYGWRLYEIAQLEEASYCVTCLERWMAGTWPPQRAVRVLDIKGVTRRGVWIRIYHRVFDVDTNLGPAFLYPPAPDRRAQLVLKSESSMSQGRVVRVTRKLMAKIEALMPALEALP